MKLFSVKRNMNCNVLIVFKRISIIMEGGDIPLPVHIKLTCISGLRVKNYGLRVNENFLESGTDSSEILKNEGHEVRHACPECLIRDRR